MRDDEIADLPLWRLSEMVRSREITSTRLTRIYLERITTYDEGLPINSYITVAREAALAQAAEADAVIESGKPLGPLHGLPFALKDNIETEGIRTTGGSKILSSHIPVRDAFVVKKLKRAGAVILGKTNMPEFALGATTNNPHYGPTRNPYDLIRTPGGSSGGSAAATAAGLAAASLGTDTGGSVRVPSGLCGVVGLRPTHGRVGRGGIIPLSFSRDCVGPITRTVRDSAMVLEVIAGRDGRDPQSASRPVPPYSDLTPDGLKGRRFGLPKRFIADMIHQDTEEIVDDAVRIIRAMGGVIREIDIPSLSLAHAADFNVVMPEAVCLLGEYLLALDPSASIEACLDLMGTGAREILGHEAGGPGSRPVPGYLYLSTLRNECKMMKAGFRKAMHGLDALLLPTTPAPAPRIDEDPEMELNGSMKSVFLTNIRNCLPLSIVGYPAISVPAGYSKAGLPIGLQIVARPWEEARLFSMAYGFEQATKCRRAPRLVRP
ncbi:MAG: amidase [Syntrophorhabdales bacterium]|jgi:aspartyl-tRNA(Asn)/glutamyl-tRNA(Gln) amidotransferase subunit A